MRRYAHCIKLAGKGWQFTLQRRSSHFSILFRPLFVLCILVGMYTPSFVAHAQNASVPTRRFLGPPNMAVTRTPNPTATRVPTNTPTPTNTPAPGPTYGNIFWRGDFETGDTSQWYWAGADKGSSISVVTSPVAQGTHAGKYFLAGTGGSDNIRAESITTQAQAGGYDGQDWYYTWSIYVPSAGQAAWSTAFNLIAQWSHDLSVAPYAGCSPPIELDITPVGGVAHLFFIQDNETFSAASGCIHGTPQTNHDLGMLPFDQWVQVTTHIKYGTMASTGYAALWLDGVKVLPQTGMRTELDTRGSIMSLDMYRPDMPIGKSNTIYHDGLIRHDAYTP